jgi:hypothetical protein
MSKRKKGVRRLIAELKKKKSIALSTPGGIIQ